MYIFIYPRGRAALLYSSSGAGALPQSSSGKPTPLHSSVAHSSSGQAALRDPLQSCVKNNTFM